MIINNNIPALNTHRQMGINQNAMQSSMEKLSSGMRINRAGDDAAGLAISEKMRAQINGLDQASRNSQDGISLIQTAEGALDETHSILQRMRELAVQAGNDTNVEVDREELQKEIDELTSEIDRIGNTTEFNTQKLLNGDQEGLKAARDGSATIQNNSQAEITLGDVSAAGTTGTITITRINDATGADNFRLDDPANAEITLDALTISAANLNGVLSSGGLSINNLDSMAVGESVTISFREAEDAQTSTSTALTFQIGANSGQTIQVGINDMRADALGLRTSGGSALDITDAGKASTAITTINNAIEEVSAQRSQLGAFQNRLEHTIANLDNASENLAAAESRIRDVDMASEMMEMTRANILSQASQSMLAQANQQPQSVLQLLG